MCLPQCRYMNYLMFVGLLILSVSCADNRNSNGINMDDLLKSSKVFMPGADSYQVLDKGKDSIIGGAYFFRNNKKLESYKFFGSKNGYTYSEEYDINGNLVHTTGSPIVYRNIKEIGKDSVFITYYLFAYNKVYFQPKFSINDSSRIDLHLEEDTLYSNMMCTSTGINIKGLSDFKLYFEVSCIDHFAEEGELLKDTLVLKTTPQLDLVH